VHKIRSLQIFDRWGEAVADFRDIQPNVPEVGWDGTFRGQPLNPAVFVWVAEIEFIDGVVELFTGDVTLVR
ncbi:MAG: gliding motility-associated C-terminal domain-containing protein, partial [Bacteroidota bacterium]